MKNWKEYTSLLLALILYLNMTAYGKNGSNEEDVINGDETGYEEDVSNGGEISVEDLDGFWYPVGGIDLTTSVLTSIYAGGTAGAWEEYDQYGGPTGNTEDVYTNGTILTATDASFLGEVEDMETPIGDTDTLLDNDEEIYRIKGQPDFKEKLGLSSVFGNWYYKGDHTSKYQTILTLNEGGTYTRSGTEEGTYTSEKMEVPATDVNTNGMTTESRQEVGLSGGFADAPFCLVDDGQVLVDWAKINEGEKFCIHESVLENGELLRLYQVTDGNDYQGEGYTLRSLQKNTLYHSYLNRAQDSVSGTWEISDDMIIIA